MAKATQSKSAVESAEVLVETVENQADAKQVTAEAPKQVFEQKIAQIITPSNPVSGQDDMGHPIETRLLAFLRNKQGYVKINEFLKVELKYSAGRQDTNKELRVKLQKLVDNGKIEVRNNAHKSLATFYYEGNDPQTKYKTVLNTALEVILK